MATEVKRRRGTTAQHTTFVGAEAELTVDTDKWTVLVHDDSGSAPTGHELLRQDFSNVTTLKVDTTYSEDGNEVQGEMYWNEDEETVTLVTNGFNLPIGHSLILNVKNDDIAQDDISKGDVVAANGTVGASGKITVTRFEAGTTPTRTIVGIAGEDIIYGEFGKVVAFGKIRKIDTATPESGSWNEGDVLYASTTAGALTKTAPTVGNVKLPIAYVVYDDANNGEIFVRITPIDENEFQQYDADLSTIAGLAKTDGNFIVGNGSAWVVESGATARTSLGLGNVEDVALSTYTGEGGSLDNQYITNGAGYVTQTDTDSLYDDYDYWTLTVGTTNQNITSQSALTLTAGDNVSLEIDGANVTISSSLPTGAIDTITTSNTSGLSSSESSGEVTLNLALGNLTAMTATPDAQEAIAILEGSTTKKIALGSIPLTALDNTSSGFISDYTVTQSDVTQHQSALAITESQITFTSSFIELADLSVATEPASGGGSLSYDSAQGLFTFTPASIPNVSSFIELTDLSVGIPDSPSGSGAISYSSANGVFTYTPPDLSGYLTSLPSHNHDTLYYTKSQVDTFLGQKDNYSSWTVSDTVNEENVTSGFTLEFAGTNGIGVSYSTSLNRITIDGSGVGGSGDITAVTTVTNSGLSGGATSGAVDLSLNINNLATLSASQGNESLAILDGTDTKNIALSNISLSHFNDDLDYVDSTTISTTYVSKSAPAVGADLDMNSNTITEVESIILVNKEGDNFDTTSGRLMFDENFYGDTEYGGTNVWTTNGGGLVIRNEDGWGRILSDKNMQYLNASFASITSSGNIEVQGITAQTNTNPKIQLIETDGNADENVELMLSGGDFFIRTLNDDGTNPANENLFKVNHEGVVTLMAQGTTTDTNLNALFQDSNGVLKRRTLGSNAFNSTAFITSSSFTVVDDETNTTDIATNDSLTISGGTGIDVAVTTGTVTITSTVTDTDTNTFVNAASFNTGDGVLTLTKNNSSTVTVDLDGRYLELGGGTLTGALDSSSEIKTTDHFTTDSGELLNLNQSGWTNEPNHYVLYNAWRSSTGDYLLAKASGNATGSVHGSLLIADNGLYYGSHGAQSQANDSATAPLDTTLLYFRSGGSYLNSDLDVNGDVSITGTLSATVKSFNIVHPTQEGKRLVYGVLEGAEHAVFVRGRSQSKVIELPEEWRGLIDPDSITVQLTAIGSAKTYYFKGCKDNKVYVGSSGFNWKYDYFYLIHATRVDVKPLQTVQDAH